MGVFRPAMTAAAVTPAVYFLLARPWHLQWGATDAEAQMPLPGDDLIPNPRSLSTRAVTINAPVEQVWPWVVQMGQGRGGFYSYDALENLVGCDIHSADRVVPELQSLQPGDEFWLASRDRFPKSVLVVDRIEPNRLLLLRSANVGESPESPGDEFGYTWAFVLQPVDSGTTRFISRGRYSGPSAAVLPVEGVQFVMEREMMRGLKRRAEEDRDTLLDQVLPEYEFRGVEAVTIHASDEQIFRALRDVTLEDMPLAYALGTLRYLPGLLTGRMKRQPGEASRPFFEIGNMNVLVENPGREIVIGSIGKLHDLMDQQFVTGLDARAFKDFDHPDHEKFAQSFRIVDGSEEEGYSLLAEHRTHALSPGARRKFAPYWHLMVGWGGNWLLRMLLAAVKRRAERIGSVPSGQSTGVGEST